MNNQKKYFLTADIGGTCMRVALTSSTGKILQKTSSSTPKAHLITKKLIAEMRRIIRKNLSKNIVGVGVSVAGPVNTKNGSFAFKSQELDVDLVAPLKKALDRPVFMINDTNAAVLAVQQKNATKEVPRDIAYITISTGIGVGAIIDGHLVCGRDGNAGELGRSTVYSPFTDEQHSWGHYVAGKNDVNKGIVRFYQKWAMANNMYEKKYKTPKALFAAAKKGNKKILRFMDEVAKINAQGIANVILAYNPAIIVFGGSIAYHNYDLLLHGIKKNLRYNVPRPLPQFKRTALGDNASLIGAALYTSRQDI